MQNSKNKKWIIIGIVLVGLWALGTVIDTDTEPITKVMPEESANVIKAKQIVHAITTDYLIKIDEEVKKQFAFPEEVSYGSLSSPTTSNTIVLDTANSIIVTAGDVIGKNAFGVKTRYQYRAWGKVDNNGPQFQKVDLIPK